MHIAMEVALLLHLAGVVVWVGGMTFAHFCLRPAMNDLSPQLRMPVWESVFSRFFMWVGASAIVVLLSGGYLLGVYGGAAAPWPLHAMAATGVVMTLIFGHIRFGIFPRLRRAVQAQNWPDGARAMAAVRRLVTVNLVLGFVTVALAVLGRG
jgi:uncharacterized membrane protein